VSAVAIDARHCGWEMCGCKRFRFARNTIRVCRHLQKIGIQSYLQQRRQLWDITTYKCLQLSTIQHSRPPQTLSLQTRCAFADVSVLSTFTYSSMHSNVATQTCPWTRLWTRLCASVLSRPHISAALPAHTIVSYLNSPANGGRDGESSWLSHRCLEQQVAVETWRVCAVSIKQQLQKPAKECVLLADIHAELRSLCHFSLLSLLGNWQAYQFTCIIRIRLWER